MFESGVREEDISGLYLRTDGARSCLFAAFRIHRNETRDLMLQRCDDCATIRFVLDELQRGGWPTLGQGPDSAQRAREIQPLLRLIEQVAIRALLAPNLPNDKIARRQVLEAMSQV